MLTRILVIFVCVLYLRGYVEANKMTKPTVHDKTGKNLCIGDLSCFLGTNQTVTMKCDLILDEEAKAWKFEVTLVKAELKEELKLIDKEYNLCYEKDGEVSLKQTSCEKDIVPPRAEPYHISFPLDIPFYKDLALLTFSGPTNLVDSRLMVSYHSAHPPITLCNEQGIC